MSETYRVVFSGGPLDGKTLEDVRPPAPVTIQAEHPDQPNWMQFYELDETDEDQKLLRFKHVHEAPPDRPRAAPPKF